MVQSQLLGEDLGISGAKPIHAVVHDVVHSRVPIVNRLHVFVVKKANVGAGILHGAEGGKFPVTNSQNQITCALGVGHAIDTVIQSVVPLQNVAKEEREGNADAALATESLVWIRNSNFADCLNISESQNKHGIKRQRLDRVHHALVVDASDRAHPSCPAHIRK